MHFFTNVNRYAVIFHENFIFLKDILLTNKVLLIRKHYKKQTL
ncbi:hypothetical protein DU19_0813 [Chlamydia muridarum]|nr:hypothetical protein DU17_0815 [Chlamydia muridarum]KDU81762.1 hypothetical protein DU18_0814 [Chlamydia muridarum]KDU82077.1 hypothetical protein DU19_0813 [Chlamydia muridarum]KDU84312.1 hypothetical protein DU21_0815 [Chlamydia muridarum]